MKIEVWSDYQCPFCYIGKARLNKALEQFPNRDKVEVSFRSFELDPNAAKDIPMNMYEMLMNKYGLTLEQVKQNSANLWQQAKNEGLDFQFDTMVLTNSFDAHRLLKFAATQGKEAEMNEALFQAYFTDSLHIGDHATLLDIAERVGLDRAETELFLNSEQFGKEVRQDEQQANQLGVTGVPFFVVNNKYGISGAQPTEVFLNTLQDVWAEDHPLQMINSTEGDVCADGSCIVPDSKS